MVDVTDFDEVVVVEHEGDFEVVIAKVDVCERVADQVTLREFDIDVVKLVDCEEEEVVVMFGVADCENNSEWLKLELGVSLSDSVALDDVLQVAENSRVAVFDRLTLNVGVRVGLSLLLTDADNETLSDADEDLLTLRSLVDVGEALGVP